MKFLENPFEEANPNPEFLIKSIAEQGYSLETALADLMDNSITANATKIEVLTDIESDPFLLFIADNGDGMDPDSLMKNMQFPSKSPEHTREQTDLGRFGLGLKTASFSQTRSFTVLSRKKGAKDYCGLTWDVDYLKAKGKWRILINSKEDILEILTKYQTISSDHTNQFTEFSPNTIVVWRGLYKFENYLTLENKKDAIRSEITDNTSEYLSIVFHRFMEKDRDPLHIRINNTIAKPFNPFPISNEGLRSLEPLQRDFNDDFVKIQGFILPNSSIKETKELNNTWTPLNKSLMDMEGIYIYRADRLILFGGWNGLIKKMPRLQLARLRVDIGNKLDHLFHLNVAKSQINIPYDLKQAFLRSIVGLKEEAQKEFYNSVTEKIPLKGSKEIQKLFNKSYSNKGAILNVNNEFPILKSLKQSLNKEQTASLNFVLKIATSTLNSIRQVENVEIVGDSEIDGISIEDIINSIKKLQSEGWNNEQIRKDILPFLFSKNNLPEEVKTLLN
jgi:hypothetical protein